MKVLVTGGLGYIGSHTVVSLLENGHEVICVDNLYNASPDVAQRIKSVSGKDIKFFELDCCDAVSMEKLFSENSIDAVIHFAGYKAVGESVREPLKYYDNNLLSTIVLLKNMKKYGVKTLVFSSSATVYAPDDVSPLKEDMRLQAINPYGQTKLMIEQILRDFIVAEPEFKVIALRYFNPIGAHPSGLLGELPVGVPNNLMPYICQVADGTREQLHVYGDDYDTVDGTGVRDYIHVVDLAEGHVAALTESKEESGFLAYNLGTGKGTSVLELVHAFEEANDLEIPYVIDPRRPGDNATVYADCSKALKELNWQAKLSIVEACRSSWNFQKGLKDR